MRKKEIKPRVVLVGEVLGRIDTPPKIALSTIAEVRREMARVYRDARQGRIETTDGTKLAFILSGIGKMILDSELEQRIEKLERASYDND